VKVERILVPTDLSPGAKPAKAFAIALARQFGAELFFEHSVLTHEHDFRQLGELLREFLEKLERESRQTLEAEVKALQSKGLAARYHVEQRASAFEAIMDRIDSYEPDIVVMGTHGRAGMARWFLGSVAEKIVRHAPCPVATVRSEVEPSETVQRILVPVDFSDNARRAVGAAISLKGEKGRLILQHVVLNPAFAGLHPGEYLRVFNVDPNLPVRIRERIEEWTEGQDVEVEVTEAEDAADSIVEVANAREVDLIVIGSRGLTGVDYFLLGSVAEKVVRQAPVPVLTIK
jgi:nucleotide-binding universal stress UspA family protein